MARPSEGQRPRSLLRNVVRVARRWGPVIIPVVLITVGWLVIVAIAAGPRPSDESWVGAPDLSNTLIWVILALAAVGLMIFVQLRPSRYAEGRPGGGIGSLLATVITVMAVIALLMDDDVELQLEQMEEAAVLEEELVPLDQGERSRISESNLEISRWDIGVGVVVFLAAVTTGVMLFRRQPASSEPTDEQVVLVDDAADDADGEADGSDVQDLVAALEHSRLVLDSIGDPRQAVLASYSHLEEAIQKRGHRRAAHETAAEHLGRALEHLPVDPRPLIDLARLYETARFSTSHLDGDDRTRALGLLDQATSQLAASEGA